MLDILTFFKYSKRSTPSSLTFELLLLHVQQLLIFVNSSLATKKQKKYWKKPLAIWEDMPNKQTPPEPLISDLTN